MQCTLACTFLILDASIHRTNVSALTRITNVMCFKQHWFYSYLDCVNGTMWWYVNQKSYNKKVCGFFSLRLKPCFMTRQTTFFVVFCENCVRVSNCRSTTHPQSKMNLSQVRLNMKTIKLHPNELQHKWCHPLQIFISELVNQQWFLGLR